MAQHLAGLELTSYKLSQTSIYRNVSRIRSSQIRRQMVTAICSRIIYAKLRTKHYTILIDNTTIYYNRLKLQICRTKYINLLIYIEGVKAQHLSSYTTAQYLQHIQNPSTETKTVPKCPSLPALNVTSQMFITATQLYCIPKPSHHADKNTILILHTISQLHERIPRRSKYGCPIKKRTTPNLQCLTSTELHLINDKQAQPLYRIIQSAYNASDVYDDTH